MIIKGNTSGSITTTALGVVSRVKYVSIVNKAGGAATVNMFVIANGEAIHLLTKDKSLASNEQYVSDVEIKLKGDAVLAITTNASIDYYLVIE